MISKKIKYKKPSIKAQKLSMKMFFQRPIDFDFNLLAGCPDTCDPDPCYPSGPCFLPGTHILTPNGQKKIETIKIGDSVISYNFNRKNKTVSRVNNLILHYTQEFYRINKKINVTPLHRFWLSSRKWVRAKNLKPGMKLFSADGGSIYVENVLLVNKSSKVHNLTLNGSHKNYFAENVLVHNWSC